MPYEGFEPRFAGVDELVLLMVGIEGRDGACNSRVRERIEDSFIASDGPDIVEAGTYADGPLWFAYWRSLDAYVRWMRAPAQLAFWAAPVPLDGEIGVWREQAIIGLDYNETSSSHRDGQSGLTRLADAVAVTDLHGYWGSARDRIAAAATDPLAADAAASLETGRTALGRHVRVVAPRNTCLIRTSQDVSQATGDQQAWYRAHIEPALRAGLSYLDDRNAESGCLGLRFVVETGAAERPERTCAVAYFHSLSALEAWTHHHPTHEAIVTAFMAMVGRFEGEPGIRLWHEVSVFPVGQLVGDYFNCRASGGLLGSRMPADG